MDELSGSSTRHPPPNAAVRLSLFARAYLVCNALLGAGILLQAFWCWRPWNILRFGAYLVLVLIVSPLKISLPGLAGGLPLKYLFILIAVMQLDYPQSLLVGLACTGMRSLGKTGQRSRAVHLLFNLPNSVIAVACCSAAFHLCPSWAVGLLAVSLSYFLANTSSMAAIICVTEQLSYWRLWYQNCRVTAPQCLAGTVAAGMLKLWIDRTGWEGPLIVLAVICLIYSSYRLYFERLRDERRHASELADLHLRTIEALAVAIEARDEAIHDHLRRVQVYAVEVARELGAAEDDMRALRAAALLHDIGKLAVPEYILSKPGRLTPEEFEKIKIHPLVGAEILRRVQFPYPVVPIVEAHHERWDGSGYPHGLKEEEIPLGARILSAVDCLDALASSREYRLALPLDEAMAFVASQSAIWFDPQVVEVLQRRYRGLEAMARSADTPGGKLSKDVCPGRTAAPAAGLAEIAHVRANGDAPRFRSAIAAARQEFQMLHEVASELGNSLSVASTLSLLGTRLQCIVPHDAIAIYVLTNGRLAPEYVQGQDAQLLSGLEIPVGRGLSGWVAENRKPLVNGSPSLEPGYCPAGKFGGLESAIAVPLAGIGGVVGVLTLYHSRRDAFSQDHLRLLLAISSKAALTIENALKFREAQNSAVTDELTGLPNARSLFLHLDNEIARCKRTNSPLTVVVADLDGFKLVNDRFGHLAGNKVLRVVAQGLKKACREYDYVARMGGDEFVLILPGMTPNAAGHKSLDLNSVALDAGRECTGEEILSLSIGEASFPEDGTSGEELLAEADRLMYQMKRSHRMNRLRDVRLEELPAEDSCSVRQDHMLAG